MTLKGRDLFNARVRDAMEEMEGRRWPLDGRLGDYPEAIRPHGVIVCRGAARRLLERENEAAIVAAPTKWRFVA